MQAELAKRSQALPRLRTAVSRPVRYFRRLQYWAKIYRSVQGRTEADQRTLRATFLRSPLTALYDLDAWQDPHLVRDACVEVRGVGVFCVRAESDDLHHVIPAAEPEVFAAVSRILTMGAVFVDAGANIGLYTVLGSRLVGPEGRVFAVEMMPDTAERLRSHVRLNGLGNVEVLEAALSDTDGQAATARFAPGKFGQASLLRGTCAQAVEVRTQTLEALLGDARRISLMKMDLEGSELSALQGAGPVLERIDGILYECLPAEDRVRPFLETRGFKVERLNTRQFLGTRQ